MSTKQIDLRHPRAREELRDELPDDDDDGRDLISSPFRGHGAGPDDGDGVWRSDAKWSDADDDADSGHGEQKSSPRKSREAPSLYKDDFYEEDFEDDLFEEDEEEEHDHRHGHLHGSRRERGGRQVVAEVKSTGPRSPRSSPSADLDDDDDDEESAAEEREAAREADADAEAHADDDADALFGSAPQLPDGPSDVADPALRSAAKAFDAGRITDAIEALHAAAEAATTHESRAEASFTLALALRAVGDGKGALECARDALANARGGDLNLNLSLSLKEHEHEEEEHEEEQEEQEQEQEQEQEEVEDDIDDDLDEFDEPDDGSAPAGTSSYAKAPRRQRQRQRQRRRSSGGGGGGGGGGQDVLPAALAAAPEVAACTVNYGAELARNGDAAGAVKVLSALTEGMGRGMGGIMGGKAEGGGDDYGSDDDESRYAMVRPPHHRGRRRLVDVATRAAALHNLG